MSRVLVRPSIIRGEVEAPPSKPYTHRVYAAALLSKGVSRVIRPLKSGDAEATRRACVLLGAEVNDLSDGALVVGGRMKIPEDVINAENSGTTLRLFTAISSLAPGGYTILTGDDSLRRRPMKPLLESLKDLGVECWSSRLNGTAPIIVRGGGIRGGETKITGEVSSQFISALLYASTKSNHGARIMIEGGLVSKPYVDASMEVLRRFGFTVKNEGYELFEVEGCQDGVPCEFKVPGDFSSAAFFMAGAHLTGGNVEVRGLSLDLPQADSAIIEILKKMGNSLKISQDSVKVDSSSKQGGGEYCLRDSPDLLPIVAVMAAKSREETIIKGVKHAKLKESDRISAIASELKKLGITVESLQDGLKIKGVEKLKGGCVLSPHGDHRMFMALVILAAATEEGCIVEDPEVAKISYPEFLDHARRLGVRIEVLEN